MFILFKRYIFFCLPLPFSMNSGEKIPTQQNWQRKVLLLYWFVFIKCDVDYLTTFTRKIAIVIVISRCRFVTTDFAPFYQMISLHACLLFWFFPITLFIWPVLSHCTVCCNVQQQTRCCLFAQRQKLCGHSWWWRWWWW